MEQRSEDEIVTMSPIKVVFGGEEYDVKLLVIKESRVWRKKLIDKLSILPTLVSLTMDDTNPDSFGKAFKGLMIDNPEVVLELFFNYAKDLNRKEIEKKATDAEMAQAFAQVVTSAFPLAKSLLVAMTVLSQLAQRSNL